MALVTTFNALTKRYWTKDFADNITQESKMWSQIYPKRQSGSGREIVVPIKSGTMTGGPYAKDGQLTASTAEVATEGVYPWRSYYVLPRIASQDALLNTGNMVQIHDLVEQKVWGAGQGMLDQLGTDIFLYSTNAARTTSIDGLNGMCQDRQGADEGYINAEAGEIAGDTAGYGDVLINDTQIGATGVYWWTAHVTRCTGADAGPYTGVPCTVESVMDMIEEIASGTNGCGEYPTVGLTSLAVYSKLRRELMNRGTYATITLGGDTVHAGFRAMVIADVPIIPDSHCQPSSTFTTADAGATKYRVTSGHSMYLLNLDYLYVMVQPQRDMTWEGWRDYESDYDRYLNKLFWWGNIVTTQRRAHGALYNIDTSVLYDTL